MIFSCNFSTSRKTSTYMEDTFNYFFIRDSLKSTSDAHLNLDQTKTTTGTGRSGLNHKDGRQYKLSISFGEFQVT